MMCASVYMTEGEEWLSRCEHLVRYL